MSVRNELCSSSVWVRNKWPHTTVRHVTDSQCQCSGAAAADDVIRKRWRSLRLYCRRDGEGRNVLFMERTHKLKFDLWTSTVTSRLSGRGLFLPHYMALLHGCHLSQSLLWVQANRRVILLPPSGRVCLYRPGGGAAGRHTIDLHQWTLSQIKEGGGGSR